MISASDWILDKLPLLNSSLQTFLIVNVLKMATKYLMLIALGTAVISSVHGCPQQCTCTDKFSQHFVDCAYKDLLEIPVGLPSSVTTLSLTANKIKVLKSKDFINMTQVTSFWMAHNEIVTVERGTLASMIQLKNLDLSFNKIVHFPWDDLSNLTALQLFKMNNNEMTSIPKNAFSNLKGLLSIRINNNKFNTIVQGTFDGLTAMSHLQIFHNPFICSCKLEWLRDWIVKSSISIPDKDNIVCEAPAHLKGTNVIIMPKLDCKAPSVSIVYQPNIDNTELYEGYMVILNCETKGNPKPDVAWEIYSGNQLITFPLPHIVEKIEVPINGAPTNTRFLVFQNGTLIILHMSKNEDGNYTCSATNDMGKATRSVRLAIARKKIPSLLIIVVVSILMLALATVPLLGATRCHLYQGKTYKLIMKTQNPDQMEKQIATEFDPRASFVGSE